MSDHCCAPERSADAPRPSRRSTAIPVDGRHLIEQASSPAAPSRWATSRRRLAADGETAAPPGRRSTPFTIDATSVTNDDFAAFVDGTGYRTEAETFGYSAVFHLALAARRRGTSSGSAAGTPWWIGVRGADWRHPGGRCPTSTGSMTTRSTHVSWNDAAGLLRVGRASAADRGRVGVRVARRAGGAPLSRGATTCSTPTAAGAATSGRARFPDVNTEDDGWLTTAPGARPSHPTGTACGRRSATSGSGAPTGSIRATTVARRGTTRAAPTPVPRPGASAAVRSSATTRTAIAIATPPGRRTPPTRRWATPASVPSPLPCPEFVEGPVMIMFRPSTGSGHEGARALSGSGDEG